MNLVFLCGSIEPGKDGVGDYTRRLAQVCREQGHMASLIALNDAWLEKSEFIPIASTYRLARSQPWSRRIATLQSLLDTLQPDWISLQFVPYAYQKKGLSHALARRLASLNHTARWHLMFHELWLGLDPAASLRHRFTGFLQRLGSLRLLQTLIPSCVHTHAAAYADVLEKENIFSQPLPLFSNIPISPPDFTSIYTRLASEGSTLRPDQRSPKKVLVFFGALHPEWNPDVLLEKTTGTPLVIISLGRLGAVGEQVWQHFRQSAPPGTEFHTWGDSTSEVISNVLQFADAGVAASPWSLLQKSGSVAAMIEHGLPVIVTRNDFLPHTTPRLDPLWQERLFPIWSPDFVLSTLQRHPPASRLEAIGQQFLHDLEVAP